MHGVGMFVLYYLCRSEVSRKYLINNNQPSKHNNTFHKCFHFLPIAVFKSISIMAFLGRREVTVL